MRSSDRRRLIARYREGPDVLEAAFAGLGDAELDRARAGGWTPREVAHHCADSELTSAVRLRRLLAEESPRIEAYDEELFARRLHYRDRAVGPSLAAVRAARMASLQLLESLGDAEWQRSGTHSESGSYGVEDWLAIYAEHCHDHAEQVRRARG